MDVKNARFPYCLVWTPLPVIAWLIPFFGHVGICREDGIILDYGIASNVNINRLAFGSTAKYVRLHPYQVNCFCYYYFLFLLFLFLFHLLNKNVLAAATYTILNISLWNGTPWQQLESVKISIRVRNASITLLQQGTKQANIMSFYFSSLTV